MCPNAITATIAKHRIVCDAKGNVKERHPTCGAAHARAVTAGERDRVEAGGLEFQKSCAFVEEGGRACQKPALVSANAVYV